MTQEQTESYLKQISTRTYYIDRGQKTLEEQMRSVIKMVSLSITDSFRPTDFTHYITQPLSNFKRLWKFNGTYINKPKIIYDILVNESKYTKTYQSFKTMIEDPKRQEEIWPLGIELIFAAYSDYFGYYITCDGRWLTKDKFSLIQGNQFNSGGYFVKNEVKIRYNRAISVLYYFKGKDVESDGDIYYIDGQYSNCSVDNVEEKDI